MTKFLRFVKQVRKDEEGATAIEYGLLAALIAVAIIVAAQLVGTQLDATFDTVGTELTNANAAGAGGGGGTTP